jgi:type III secretion apparatus needle protein
MSRINTLINNLINTSTGRTTSTNSAASTTSGSTNNVNNTSFSGAGAFEGSKSVTVPDMPKAADYDLTNPNKMAEYQEKMQHYTQMLQLKSQIISMLHDTRKNMVSNMRA